MKRSIILAAAMAVLCGCAENRTELQTEMTSSMSESVTISTENVTEDTEASSVENELPEEDYIYEIVDGEAHINKYKGEETEVVIPDSLGGCPVTYVSRLTFAHSDTVSITFPETVTKLGKLGIISSLERLYLPAGIEELSAGTFKECDKLREIVIAEGGKYKSVDGIVYTADGKELVYFPSFACEGKFTVPDGVKKIGSYAFAYSCITELVCPDSLKEIGDYAFEHAENLSSVTLNEGLTVIGKRAFLNYGDKGIRELTLPDSVESAGTGFVNEDVFVSAAADIEGLSCLYDIKNVEYRNDNSKAAVNRAIYKGIKEFERIYDNDFYDFEDYRVIFSDIIGDAYPEMLVFRVGSSITPRDIYSYKSNEWQYISYYGSDCYKATCYDKKNNSYFDLQICVYISGGCSEGFYVYPGHLCVYKLSDDCSDWSLIGRSNGFYPLDSYRSGAVARYYAGGSSEIKYYTPQELKGGMDKAKEDFKNFVISSLEIEGCEIVKEYNAEHYAEHYNALLENSEEQIIYDIDLSDIGEISEFDYTEPAKKEVGEINGRTVYEDDDSVWLYRDDISYDTFTTLSKLPKLTAVYIDIDIGDDASPTDLSGIEQLSGLKYLYLGDTAYENIQKLSELKSLEWLNIGTRFSDISFLSDMESVRVLQFSDGYFTQSADTDFSPIYDMESLEYLLASRDLDFNSDFYFTVDDEEALRKNRPDVKIGITAY